MYGTLSWLEAVQLVKICIFFLPASTSSPSKKIKLTQNLSFSDDDILDFKVSSARAPSPVNSSGGESPASSQEEPQVLENGELEELLSEEEASTTTVEPPPIPPRNHSLSPGPPGSFRRDYLKDDTGKADIYNSDFACPWIKEASSTSGPFLSEGRGGERAHPPPLPRITNGISATAGDDEVEEEIPPPVPSKAGRKKSRNRLEEITEEERALVGELDMLEKLMESQQDRKPEASASSMETTAETKTEEQPVEEESAKG